MRIGDLVAPLADRSARPCEHGKGSFIDTQLVKAEPFDPRDLLAGPTVRLSNISVVGLMVHQETGPSACPDETVVDGLSCGS